MAAKTITVTSGKGGVGKTNLCANLAIQLASLGHRTCIFDADLGLANINILLGIYPEKTIEDVILGSTPLQNIIITNYNGIDIIPGSSGVEQIADLESKSLEFLIKSFSMLDTYDYLFFDTSAGVSKNVVSFCLSSAEIIIVITPEPTSLTDAYALLKILCLNGLQSPVRVVVNHCKDAGIAKQTYARFKEVAKKYLAIDIHPLGFMMEDQKVSEAVKHQQPFITLYPDTIASKCIKSICNNLLQSKIESFEPKPITAFWKHFVAIAKGQMNLKGFAQGKKEEKRAAPQPDLFMKKQESSGISQIPHDKPEHPPVPSSHPVHVSAPESIKKDASSFLLRKEQSDISLTDINQISADQIIAAPLPEMQLPSEPSITIEHSSEYASSGDIKSTEPAPAHLQMAEPEKEKLFETIKQTIDEVSHDRPGAVIKQETADAHKTLPQYASSSSPGLPLDQNMYSLLNKLVGSIASISEEFTQVRKAFESNGASMLLSGSGSDKAQNQQKPIILDFEKYAETRTGNQ